jgi:thymidylate synthase
LKQGSPVTSRGMPTLELYPVAFAIRSPRRRCITNPERRWSLPLALGEFCWHATGSNELGFIEYYALRWREFADGVAIIGSCYGHNIFHGKNEQPSQWDRLVHLLRVEPHSRRAVLQLFDHQIGLDPDTRDAPCTCNIQFMIRDERLHAIVYMRSNDAIWGLPYDVFLFTMLQELLSCTLGIELGSYFHVAGSLHLYQRHFELAKRILSCRLSFHHEMPSMHAHHQLERFLNLENRIRYTGELGPEAPALDPYWRHLLDVLRWYARRQRNSEQGTEVALDSDYASLLRNTPPIRGAREISEANALTETVR